jgi:hypothetical protein
MRASQHRVLDAIASKCMLHVSRLAARLRGTLTDCSSSLVSVLHGGRSSAPSGMPQHLSRRQAPSHTGVLVSRQQSYGESSLGLAINIDGTGPAVGSGAKETIPTSAGN